MRKYNLERLAELSIDHVCIITKLGHLLKSCKQFATPSQAGLTPKSQELFMILLLSLLWDTDQPTSNRHETQRPRVQSNFASKNLCNFNPFSNEKWKQDRRHRLIAKLSVLLPSIFNQSPPKLHV